MKSSKLVSYAMLHTIKTSHILKCNNNLRTIYSTNKIFQTNANKLLYDSNA